MDVMCRFGLGIPITSAKSAFKERYCCSVCIVQYIFLCDCCGFLFFQNELDCADTGVFVYSETYSSPVKPLRSSLQWILLINKIVNIWNIEHHDIIFLHGSGVGTFSIFFFISCMLCCMFFFFLFERKLVGLNWKSFKTSSFMTLCREQGGVRNSLFSLNSLPRFHTMLFISTFL